MWKSERRRTLGGLTLMVLALWSMLFVWNSFLWADDERLDAVDETLSKARHMGVALLAPSRLEKVEAHLSAARDEAAEQRRRAAPWRHFLNAESHLNAAKRDAKSLHVEAAGAFKNAHHGAQRHLSTAQKAVEHVVDLHGRVPRGRDTQLELLHMRRDVQRLAGNLNHAELAFTGGEPILAGSLARQVEADAEQLARIIDLSMSRRWSR